MLILVYIIGYFISLGYGLNDKDMNAKGALFTMFWCLFWPLTLELIYRDIKRKKRQK